MYIKSKELAVPIGPEVAAFAAAMEAKLRLDGLPNVQAWEKIPIAELKRQLALKVNKLLQNEQEDGLFLQSVIIGAFAMMIAEQSARKSRPKDGAPEPVKNQRAKILRRAVPTPAQASAVAVSRLI